jgi:glutamine phosphoribosylpyrophosphate amidotransferase
VDSLHYLTIEKLIEAVPKDEGVSYCTACFTGEYPVEYDKKQNKLVTEE